MKPPFFCFGVLYLLAVLAGSLAPLRAAPGMEVEQAVYDNLRPGDQFVVDFRVLNSGPADVVGYGFYAWAGVEDVFVLMAQFLEEPVDQPLFLGSLPFAVTTGNPESPIDFGAYNESFTQGFGPGSSPAQSLTFSIAEEAAPGSYTLTFGWVFPEMAGPVLVDADGNEFQMNLPLVVAVTIVPEPGVFGLFGAGLLVLMAGRLRKRRS